MCLNGKSLSLARGKVSQSGRSTASVILQHAACRLQHADAPSCQSMTSHASAIHFNLFSYLSEQPLKSGNGKCRAAYQLQGDFRPKDRSRLRKRFPGADSQVPPVHRLFAIWSGNDTIKCERQPGGHQTQPVELHENLILGIPLSGRECPGNRLVAGSCCGTLCC